MSKDPVAFPPAPALSDREFEMFRRLAYDKFGLNLTTAKRELVTARLSKKLRETRLPSFEAYYDRVMADHTGESLAALIDALSTNHTSFLREASHFDFLSRTVLPGLRGRTHVDVWSAACSTGEEPYSIAITLLEALGPASRTEPRIRATDISTRALASAQTGTYPAQRLSGLPGPLVQKYFAEAGAGLFQARPGLRRLMDFGRVNLVDSLPPGRAYPVIFCRNLMIYFDKPTQERVVNGLAGRLEPGGYLFTGHSESLMGIRHPLEYVQPAIYRLPEGEAK